MLTVDTITDEQIRDLREEHGSLVAGDLLIPSNAAWAWPPHAHNEATVANVCASALGEIAPRHILADYGGCMEWCGACRNKRNARARCAEILNAMKKGA